MSLSFVGIAGCTVGTTRFCYAYRMAALIISLWGICQLCGLIDPHYDEEERGEFIAYWLGRPERFATQHQWMMKFVKMLKSRRYQRKQTDTIGYQQMTVATTTQNISKPSQRALEMIAHAQQLKQQQGEDHE